MGSDGEASAVEGVRALLLRAVADLEASGARDEAVARLIPAQRRFLVTRDARMESLGRSWRLGVFLLDRDASLRATGLTTRAIEPGRAAYQSASAEERREYRAAAFRGRFTPGETVNFDTRGLELSIESLRDPRGPLVLRDGQSLVRWSTASESLVAFDRYLTERVELLVNPPAGA